jgi:hypothetical protein
MKTTAILLSLLLCSCSVYKNDFDCAPGKGVPCQSTSQISSMVVEREGGDDVFIPSTGKMSLNSKCKGCRNPSVKHVDLSRGFVDEDEGLIYQRPKLVGRVWVNSQNTPMGSRVSTHYIYFTFDEERWASVGLTKDLEKQLSLTREEV